MITDVIHEKGSGTINEDAVSLNGNLFGVFDGATSLTRNTYENDKTGGFLASKIARDTFMENHGPLPLLAEKANSAIYEKMLEHGVNVSDKASLWSTSCAVVRIGDDHIEWVQAGDSLLLMIYDDGSFHIPVTDYDHDRETLLMWKDMAESSGEKKIFDLLKDQILKIRAEMNVTYGVLNGEADYARFLNTGKAPRHNVKHILLFTDGLFLPSAYPDKDPDFSTFVSIFLEGGLKALRNHVRNLEMTDPDCIIFPRFKPHDDIAAVSISL
ncbi:protein phosphatase 2C domain-containing protein [Desulforegula conservatrix]|uniref:protein phosphatase 2C domain-containing protein n=1 Tax=Desulforegula conservatrix TaxID=153026 RepID=UPI000426D7E8|nr:protein phosphatase 2C domain-containing protein [Desulforegula conservatrix]